jgi:pyridinium-3,5-biscarboxylic acid mononucleotide synthase
MTPDAIRKLLDEVKAGRVSPEDAMSRLRTMPFEDIGFAKIDHHRAVRAGMPEVIYSAGKSAEQVAEIFSRMVSAGTNVLATRASRDKFEAVHARVPAAEYHELSQTITLKQDTARPGKGMIAVVCAGTSDIPVAEEAAITADLMGNEVQCLFDVGVAGIHRLLMNNGLLRAARVIIVCAGMEGALPSVVGGLVGVPVIAVPTSIGYGASFGGLAALLGCLNSCAPNVAVVNVDNGFGAAYFASMINRQ